ncbi:MAG: tetratricopeptide repeat protein [Elusimicrobiota bacterium]
MNTKTNKKFLIGSGVFIFALLGFIVFAETEKEIEKSFKKGIEYSNEGKYDQAIKEFTKIITNEKDYANAYFAMGIVYINKKMENEAEKLLEKAVELDPDNSRAHFVLARLYEKLEQEEKAIKTWENYIKLSSDDKHEKIAEKHLKRLRKKIENKE